MKAKNTNERIIKLFLVALVAFAMTLSGCTDILGNNSGGAGNGISIKMFRADMPAANCNQQVNLQLKIENGGDYDAQVATRLFVIDPMNWGVMGPNPANTFTLKAVTDKNIGASSQIVSWQLKPDCNFFSRTN